MEMTVNFSVTLAELSTFLMWFSKTPVSRKNNKRRQDPGSCWQICCEAPALVSLCNILRHNYDADFISSIQNLLICSIHFLGRIEPISLNLRHTNITFLFFITFCTNGLYSLPWCPPRWGFIHFNKLGLLFHSFVSGNSFTMTFYLWKGVWSYRKKTQIISIMYRKMWLWIGLRVSSSGKKGKQTRELFL